MTTENADLILGYDDHCSTCTGIARGVEAASHGRLTVLPLRSSEFQSLGAKQSSRERPTLIAREHDQSQSYVGVAAAVQLLRRLGLRSTWSVSKELWRIRSGQRTSETGGGLTRRGLVHGVLGISVGLMMLGSSRPAAARGADAVTGLDPRDWMSRFTSPAKQQELSAEEARAAWFDASISAGVQGIISMPDVRAAASGEPFALIERPTTTVGVNHQAEDGSTLEAIAVQVDRVAIVQYRYVVDGGAGTETIAYELEADDEHYRLLALHDGREGVAIVSACPSRCSPGQCSYNPCEFCGARCCRGSVSCAEGCCIPCIFACGTWPTCLACVLVWCPYCMATNRCCYATQSWCINNCV